jgi:tetratricopeptide (TPR) repeat protein
MSDEVRDEVHDDIPEEFRDPFTRAMAIATVVATLLAGVTGFLLAIASRHSDANSFRAQQLAIKSMGELTASQQTAQADYETYALAQEQRTRASNAEQRSLFNREGNALKHAQLEQARWQEIATKTEALTPISSTSEFGPDSDPLFPTKFFTSQNEEALRLSALQDAANVAGNEWQSQQSGYTAVITIFAVALYLFGLSLTLGSESKRLFAGVGIALVVIGFLWALLIFVRPPKPVAEDAAKEYAAGQIAYETAANQEDYRAAADHFTKAIDLRPNFALAYLRRSHAEYLAGSPQTSGYVTFSDPKALDAAQADLEQARELGLENYEVLASLGAYYFQQGVFDNDPGQFEKSIEATRAALEVDPKSTLLKFNLAIAQFASGDADAARATYEEAAGTEGKTDTFLVSSAMADLDLLAEKGSGDVKAQAPAMKAFVAGVTSLSRTPDYEPGNDYELTNMEATMFPSQVQLKFGVEGTFDPARNLVDVFWYHLDEDGLGWSPVPEVSVPNYATPDSDSPGSYFIEAPYLTVTSPQRCIAAGQYKAEVYANGKLVGTVETQTEFSEMEAASLIDLNSAICKPEDWERAEDPNVSRPGLLRGYLSPDKSEGIYMFHFNLPSSYDTQTPADRTRTFVDYAVKQWDLNLPGTPVFDRQQGTYFMGLDGAEQSWYRYNGGFVRVGGGVDTDGSIIVGLVYAPTDFFTREQGKNGPWILDSAIRYTEPTET